MAKILKNVIDPSMIIIDHGYMIYIDTTVVLDSRSLGTFAKDYNINKDDLLLKTLPELTSNGVVIGRATPEDGKRFLHSIAKNNKDKLVALAKFLKFPYDPTAQKDSRAVILDTLTVKVIDYTEKSVAIFTLDPETNDKLRSEKCLKFNSSLTGPGLVKAAGYILAKSSKAKDRIMDMLQGGPPVSGSLGDPTSAPPVISPEGFEFNPEGHLGEGKIKLWGKRTYCVAKLEHIEEDYEGRFKIVSKKPIDAERIMYEIDVGPETV